MEVNNEVNASIGRLGLTEQRVQIFFAGCVRPDDLGARFVGKLIESAQSFGNRGIGQDEFSAFAMDRLSDFPCDTAVVEGAKNDTFFSVEETVSAHDWQGLMVS